MIDILDKKAKEAANAFCNGNIITDRIISTINDLYMQEIKIKEKYEKDDNFEYSYHNPITSNLEFYISRIFYHISSEKNLGWKIYLRKQIKKCAPDIRIEKNNETILVLEIKARGGWLQAFFSKETFEKEKEKEKGKYNPEDVVKNQIAQLEKYHRSFNTKNIFMFLPTYASVHRKSYNYNYNQYKKYFNELTKFPEENLIVLSSDLNLDLKEKLEKDMDIKKTNEFENMLNKLLASTHK